MQKFEGKNVFMKTQTSFVQRESGAYSFGTFLSPLFLSFFKIPKGLAHRINHIQRFGYVGIRYVVHSKCVDWEEKV